MKRIALLAILVFMVGHTVQASEPLSPIQQAMLRIRDARIEHMVVFDAAGNEIGESAGDSVSVTMPDVRLYGTTILHNHPPVRGGSPFFSAMDIRFAAIHNVQRSVVIAPVMLGRDRVYIECTLDRGQAKYWPTDIYTSHDPKSDDPDSFAVLDRRTETERMHAVWWEYTERHNLIYYCQVLS